MKHRRDQEVRDTLSQLEEARASCATGHDFGERIAYNTQEEGEDFSGSEIIIVHKYRTQARYARYSYTIRRFGRCDNHKTCVCIHLPSRRLMHTQAALQRRIALRHECVSPDREGTYRSGVAIPDLDASQTHVVVFAIVKATISCDFGS
jgi:hypothetical protein